ncbi:TetR/AcrR family transcriptional regulator [Sciscionella marina]|uniref:TetR/AcrR family transcriptional regulator n=1 Tax=Sciscionella marina TaxID=508770 RepID=UPI0003772FC5|nr:TetR/AcrR family transcriptional regulator [Sciscionella marina]
MAAPRRTQAQRRAETRQALLEATIDCVVEHGYGNVTTAQIALRAGVTRGAQNYHFSAKTELVAAALEHLMDQLIEQVRLDPPRGTDTTERALLLLDRLWNLHDTPAFKAATEIAIASRTDTELRARLAGLNRRLIGMIRGMLDETFPELTGNEDIYPIMLTVLSAVRGVAVVGLIGSPESIESLWRIVRGQLEQLIARAVDKAVGKSASGSPRP